MSSLVHWLSPGPAADLLPEALPSPFDDGAPHPLAREAALAWMATLRETGHLAPGYPAALLARRPEGGKMLGVLAVVDPASGRVGVLRAFSGQLDGRWELPGFAPPLFDAAAREAVEPESDGIVKALTARLEAHAESAPLREARAERAALLARHDTDRGALRRELTARRAERRRARERLLAASAGAPPSPEVRVALAALDAESRRDDAERRAAEEARRATLGAVQARLAPLERRLRALERLRRVVSQEAMRRIHDAYVLTNVRGAQASLRELFAPGEPPWGAGDCAGPKLLGAALRLGLEPLALAEFWWGPPPAGGGRVEGAFYPSCRPKCGPLLPFLLDGLAVAPRATWRPRPLGGDALPVRFEDARVAVVVKPPGMLSVPARDVAVTDSAWARLRARYPAASGPLLVHRLDLDTSGLLLVALDAEAHRYLQAQFLARRVEKRYVAWLEGEVAGEAGVVSLPLRVDLEQRPRQVVDFVHGREAVTAWRVLERRAGRTRVELVPRTGRTHQLRVHAAHPRGLGCPIVGDRLYGAPHGTPGKMGGRSETGERLLLHAERLSFEHPDGRRLCVEAPAGF